MQPLHCVNGSETVSEISRTDPHYGIPVHAHEGLESLNFSSAPCINEVNLFGNVDLHFYAHLAPADILYVAFHGAMRVGRDVYPRFERVASLNRRSSTFLSFSDPTWHLSPDMALSWFLGGPDWDALDPIETVIRHAMQFVGASKTVFLGGSGGGFAALRAGIRFPGSLAYVQSPQTVVTRYLPATVDRYFDSVWRGDKREIAMSFPHRFDLTSLYRSNPGINYVYYLQNLNDPTHIRDHYKPFKRIHGVSEVHGTSPDGTKRFYLSDSELLRHGPPSPAEFETNFNRAMKFYRLASASGLR